MDASNMAAIRAERERAQTDLARHRKSKSAMFAMRAGVAGGVLGTLSVASAAGSSGGESKDSFDYGDVLALSLTVGVAMAIIVGFSIPWLVTRRAYMKNQNVHFSERLKAEKERHSQAMEQLRKTTELATLMEWNQDQIKTYHDIVTEQADKSFKSSRTAMHTGLALLVAAAISGVKVPIEEVRWFIGALALFSTMFAAYLSRTYLAMYKESIGQLNRYFDQPVLNSYFLTAERVTEGLDKENQLALKQQIINEVLATSSRMSVRSNSASEPAPAAMKAVKPKPKKKAKPKKHTASLNGTPRA
ncbi:hypothetical protein [Streptomyces ortus]|uniref:DUF4231 domain-containing protein n=1 Tax=Streptomyces ortus TaxID=2867268 RepID=A0ABT3UYY4_9ACTN|nr:hypothetical protein [Streptomyces ortus]MCX4232795.1 hypothetical protein [Streptomyces ortus]